LATGAPILVVFAVKVGRRHYRFACDPAVHLTAPTRAEREDAMAQAATAYLARLHEMALAYPEQWQTFGEFLSPGP
jgi:predicted LPLAT superfamily acyltransferase